MAALFADDQWFCGGSLISDALVLTDANFAKYASEMKVMLGAHIMEVVEEGRIELVTRDFFTHDKYSLHNDLVIFQKINFTSMTTFQCTVFYVYFQTQTARVPAFLSRGLHHLGP